MHLISQLLAFFGGLIASRTTSDVSFDQNYNITWGYDHVWALNQGREVVLSLDYPSGYSYHYFLMRLATFIMHGH